MGAAAGSGVGSLFKLQEQEKLALACAGIAAAIEATFTAPNKRYLIAKNDPCLSLVICLCQQNAGAVIRYNYGYE